MSLRVFGVAIVLCILLASQESSCFDYKEALSKSLLYYEAQRSGILPPSQRVQWRANSGLQDGRDSGIDLVGGYYDAGDNLKLGFPMSFTITMLSWSTIEFRSQLKANNELTNALFTIKWGTDYLIKAHNQQNILYAGVGDSDSDHACWERPEDMTTPRTVFKIDCQHPGSDLAAETAAAFAAASIAFNKNKYGHKLLNHAEQDEHVWAAAWLHRATNNQSYSNFLSSANTGGVRPIFSWDDKFIGAQVLAAKLVLENKVENSGKWAEYKNSAEEFICSCVEKGSHNVRKTPGGLMWFLPWNNVQYVATATLVTTVYSNYLRANQETLQCSGGSVEPSDLLQSVQSQVDYILGSNPENMSYMVGLGSKFPEQIHHRGASIVSVRKDPTPVTCKGGYTLWFNRNEPNPNVLEGAVVSPNENDGYTDARADYQLAEPTTVTNAPLVGVLAQFA